MTFFDFELADLAGNQGFLEPLRGAVVLAVNVASNCGYTPQYAGLEALYRELKDEKFAVVGFPCNQFGAQEAGSAAEIREFCALNYDVSFPLAAKIEVNGRGRDPLYAWLTASENGFEGDIEWNFAKFLISRAGRPLRRYPSGTTPRDKGLLQDIADAL